MTEKKQIIIILSLAAFLGILRSFFLDGPEFTLIKQERLIEKVHSFKVPDDMTGPMMVNLEFSKYHFDAGTATFIDARDPEEYDLGHIQGAINIPFDYYEEYEDLINELDEEKIYAQLIQLTDVAERKGIAIGIGHVKPQTLAVLKKHIPELQQKGFKFEFVSKLVN